MLLVRLIDEPVRVTAPSGLVYSTLPTLARGGDGYDYYIKGPDPAVVVAELLGYSLATHVGLSVPAYGVCRHPENGMLHFASRAVPIRSGLLALHTRGLVDNPEVISECFAFDVWTANTDRNEGNFVGGALSGSHRGHVRLFAIDFESARVLRGVDRFTIGAIPPRELQPRPAIWARCCAAPFPAPMCSAINRVTDRDLSRILSDIEGIVGADVFTWRASAADYLYRRAQAIRALADEVWNA